VKDLSEIITKEYVLDDSEFMESVFVCVPRNQARNWMTDYERLSTMVVPRSAKLIAEDNDYQLYRVVIFKKVIDEFKRAARDKKYVVRDFVYDPKRNSQDERKKLEAEKERSKASLARWCKTNFGEAFEAWIHLKAIRVFVESVLRYGLPTNFQAMLLLPNKNRTKNLRKVLHDLYSHLTSKSVFSGKGETETEEDENFFPYVCLEVNLDYRKATL